MTGEINRERRSASVNVWVDGVHYHLKTAKVNEGAAAKVAEQALQAIVRQDWGTLYDLLAADVKNAYTKPQFIQVMSGQSGPRMASGVLDGTGQGGATQSGVVSFKQPIRFVEQQAGGVGRQLKATMYLVLEKGEWRVVTTSALVPS
jgi:hypothetical protein